MAQRIEYIDAMRGLAMLLVVVGHVFVFSFKDMDHILFRILSANLEVPLFFMVSGFLIKMPTHRVLSFIRKKAFLLCIPATIFLTVYVWAYDYNYLSAWIDSYKYGYWFTFSLFEFIVLYVVLKYMAKRMKLGSNATNLLLLIAGIIILGASVWCARREGDYSIIPLLNLIQFKHFIYFVLGAFLAERKLLCQSSHVAETKIGGVILFFCFLLHLYTYKGGGINYIASGTLWIALTTTSGLLVLLMGFKQYASWSTSWIGKKLQLIGRYTLDIYFIHYFFLPRNLSMVGEWFGANPNPLVEYIFALIIAIVLIAVSLLFGRIIRLNPVMAHWLLGEK